MQYDVFISYSSKDSATAQAICHELEDNHIRCWMAPRDIPIGSKYATVITDAIISSKAVVLVFSERSAISPWVESEINIAFSNRKPIIPYKIDKVHLEDYSEFYLMLNNRHWIEAYPDFKTRFAELVEVVSKIVSPNAKKNLVKQGETEKARLNVLTAKPSSAKIPTSESSSSFSYKKLLLSAVVCILTVLAIIFLSEPKASGGDTLMGSDSITLQTGTLPPAGRQNNANRQPIQQLQHQSKLPAESPNVMDRVEENIKRKSKHYEDSNLQEEINNVKLWLDVLKEIEPTTEADIHGAAPILEFYKRFKEGGFSSDSDYDSIIQRRLSSAFDYDSIIQ